MKYCHTMKAAFWQVVLFKTAFFWLLTKHLFLVFLIVIGLLDLEENLKNKNKKNLHQNPTITLLRLNSLI